MITGFVKGQELNISTPIIVADTINYLTAEFHFQTSDWQGLIKWAHFSQGETVYDIKLDGDKINRSKHLNLSVGEWSVYLHGNNSEGMRITTETQTITVKNTGALNGLPLPELPLTVAEQLSASIGDLSELETTEKENLVSAINEAYLHGKGEEGEDGTGIESIEQTTTSTQDEGINVVTVTLTNGEKYTFDVRNGSKGSKGDPYTLTEEDKAEISASMSDAGYVKNTDYATTEKAGIVELATYAEAADALRTDVAVTPDGLNAAFENRLGIFTNKNSEEQWGEYFPPSTGYMKDYVDVQIGDISSALDELHAYAQALIGGAE